MIGARKASAVRLMHFSELRIGISGIQVVISDSIKFFLKLVYYVFQTNVFIQEFFV